MSTTPMYRIELLDRIDKALRGLPTEQRLAYAFRLLARVEDEPGFDCLAKTISDRIGSREPHPSFFKMLEAMELQASVLGGTE